MELRESSYVQFGAPGNGTVRLPWALPSNALPASLLAWEDGAWMHQEIRQEGCQHPATRFPNVTLRTFIDDRTFAGSAEAVLQMKQEWQLWSLHLGCEL